MVASKLDLSSWRIRNMAYFDTLYERLPGGACWPWTGYINTGGHGVFSRSPQMLAHRAAWLMAYEVPLDGLRVVHSCGSKACVNPSHLSAVEARLAFGLATMLRGGCALTGDQVREVRGIYAQSVALFNGWREAVNEAKARGVRPLPRKPAGIVSVAALARLYGVGVGSMHALLRGASYKHVLPNPDNSLTSIK